MAFKDYRFSAGLRHRYPFNTISNPRSVLSYLRLRQKRPWVKRSVKSAGDHNATKPKSRWPLGEQQHHFGPKARIPDFFQKNQLHLKLAAQRLHHNLLEAVEKVRRLESRINYTFRNKMTCVEALKATSSVTPLLSKDKVYEVSRNNRLALLGDRVLGLALCELWFSTRNSSRDYMKMRAEVESRVSLAFKGRALGIHKLLLLSGGVDAPRFSQVAEAFEAVIGAIYLDSGGSIEVVKKVINYIKLDDHKFLRPNSTSHWEQGRREIKYHHVEEGLMKRKALALQKEIQDVGTLVTEQQGDKPIIDPQIRVTTITRTAELPDHKTTALEGATEDEKTIQGLTDNLTPDSRAEVRVKKRMEHLISVSSRKKEENPLALRKKRREFEPTIDHRIRADSKKNAVDDSQPVENIWSDNSTNSSNRLVCDSPPAPWEMGVDLATTEPPECASETIVDLVKRIKKLNRLKKTGASWRARRRWSTEYLEILKVTWAAAIKKALDLRELGVQAHTLALYEEILQEKLEAILERQQRWRRELDAANALKQDLAPKDPQETIVLGTQEHNPSDFIQKVSKNPEKPKQRPTEPAPLQNKVDQAEFDFLFPKEPTKETRTYIWNPPTSKKTVVCSKSGVPIMERLPPRYGRRARHRSKS